MNIIKLIIILMAIETKLYILTGLEDVHFATYKLKTLASDDFSSYL